MRRRGTGFSATVHTASGVVHVQACNRTELKRRVREVGRAHRVVGASAVNLKTRERIEL